jgi:tetratricopeptide (TPR) repeat protein
MDAARIALAQHRYDEGLRYARAANERRPTVSTERLLGLLLLRAGDQEGGVRELRRAAALAPGDDRLEVTLAAATAIPALERERARPTRDPDVLYNLAAAYALTQQYEKSRAVLAVLERLAPDHAGARDLLRRLPPP